MSKFKIGDEVMLSPESKWVEEDSKEFNSFNPLNMKGVIIEEDVQSERHKWTVEWSNERINTYSNDDLLLVAEVSVRVETNLHDIIEEQAAHIETLEEALETVTKELIELRQENSNEFKPICEMTMEDWEQAKEEEWVFEMAGDEVFVQGILEVYKDDRHPIELGLLETNLHHGTVTVEGHFYAHKADHYRNVTKRIK